MVNRQGAAHSVRHRLGWKLMTSAAVIALATGCTKSSKKDAPQNRLAAFNYSQQGQREALKPNHPMHIATAKWARKHQKDPSDATAALNYARNLKALGAKDKAFDVLARTYQLRPGNAELSSEYGRLALDLGKVQMAEQLLNRAMRARGQPDWRLLSAMGTVQAKRGNHKKAQSYYLAALKQQPGATSVYNNLALSYALDGNAGDAENLLKQAVEKGHNTQVVRQNLALVLGLQSKFDEAQQMARTDLDSNRIDNNVSYLRSMVKATKVAKAPRPEPVRTARAAKPAAVKSANADMTATAALPRKKPATQTTVKPAPVMTAKAASTPVKATAASRPSAAPTLPKAIAKSLSKEQKAEAARPLPWRKKPKQKPEQKPEKTTVAALQSRSAAAATWSISVNEASAPATPPIAPPAKKEFKFPAVD